MFTVFVLREIHHNPKNKNHCNFQRRHFNSNSTKGNKKLQHRIYHFICRQSGLNKLNFPALRLTSASQSTDWNPQPKTGLQPVAAKNECRKNIAVLGSIKSGFSLTGWNPQRKTGLHPDTGKNEKVTKTLRYLAAR